MKKFFMKKNELYDDHAEKYARVIENNIYNAHFERPSLFSLLPDVNGKKILDAGCGSGEHMLAMAKKGADVVGFDFSKKLVDIAENNFKKNSLNAEIFVHDLNQPLIMLGNEKFDLVICALAIHYISDLKPLFKEFSRVLKNRGTLVLSTHHPICDYRDSPSQNYFLCEELTQEWNTIDTPVLVSFYRRPLNQLIGPALAADFHLNGFSEGTPDEELKKISPEHYQKLTTSPSFIFFSFIKSAVTPLL